MSGNASVFGRCPQCGREISEAYLIIEYETDSGESAAYAECPGYDAVVAPE